MCLFKLESDHALERVRSFADCTLPLLFDM
jgi:hypothetical protein